MSEVVALLRNLAESAGPMTWRAHSTPGSGWGITAKRDGRVFCRFDPKPTVPHVCVQIKGASEDELKVAGTVHRRTNAEPWVDVNNVRSARLLEPLIARAYASVGVAARPHTTAHRGHA